MSIPFQTNKSTADQSNNRRSHNDSSGQIDLKSNTDPSNIVNSTGRNDAPSRSSGTREPKGQNGGAGAHGTDKTTYS